MQKSGMESRGSVSGEAGIPGEAGRGLVQPAVGQIVLGASRSFARGFSAAYLVRILLLLAPKLARLLSKRCEDLKRDCFFFFFWNICQEVQEVL